MALIKELKGSFVGGKVSKPLQNRIDLEKFNTWLTEAKNTQIKPEGSISNRAGTVFIGNAKDSTFRLTINVDVSSTIIINGEIYKNVTTKSVDLEVGSEYTYEVSAVGYDTKKGSGTINKNEVIEVRLEADANDYTFEITPTPVDATVTINGTEQSSVTEPAGTLIEWEVSKTGYVTQSGSFLLSSDTESPMVVTLEEETSNYSLNIQATPSDADIEVIINGEDTYSGVGQLNLNLENGDTYSFQVSCSGYVTETESGTISGVVNKTVYLQQNVEITLRPERGNGVAQLINMPIYKTGTFKIEIGATSASGSYAHGGTALLQVNMSVGDFLSVRKIYGGSVYLHNEYAFGGVGIGVWLNGECILAVGGSGIALQTTKAGVKIVANLGGGGYNGGDATNSYSPSIINDSKGYSYNGDKGNNTAINAYNNANGYTSHNEYGYGYGGSGYVKSTYSSDVVWNGASRSKVKITYMEG